MFFKLAKIDNDLICPPMYIDLSGYINQGLLLLEQYCSRWKLTVNTTKTKNIIFQKGGRATFKF